jgi:epoxyqueuosine reductase
MLIHPKAGSFFFLSEILTTASIEIDTPKKMPNCGTCATCIDSCPTGAIVAPYEVDARRCISYLTIENKGYIPESLRQSIGTRIFGCDTCQVSCPWNRFEKSEESLLFGPVASHFCHPDLPELIKLDDLKFKRLYNGTPIFRIGRLRFLRNVAVALGNSGGMSDIANLEAAKTNTDDLVKEHINWAIEEIKKRDGRKNGI